MKNNTTLSDYDPRDIKEKFQVNVIEDKFTERYFRTILMEVLGNLKEGEEIPPYGLLVQRVRNIIRKNLEETVRWELKLALGKLYEPNIKYVDKIVVDISLHYYLKYGVTHVRQNWFSLQEYSEMVSEYNRTNLNSTVS